MSSTNIFSSTNPYYICIRLSIAIAPIEYEVSLSNIGFHVVPALSVIHTPPEPAVIYQIFSLFGCIAISEILPDKKQDQYF